MKEGKPESQEFLSQQEMEKIVGDIGSPALSIGQGVFVIDLPGGGTEEHEATPTIGDEQIPIEHFLSSRLDALGV